MPRVTVYFADSGRTTDADGRFSFGSVPSGRWRLGAEVQGYLMARLDGKTPASRGFINGQGIYVTIEPGQQLSLDIYMLSGGTIAGTLRNTQGEPLVEVTARALRKVYNFDGTPQLRQLASGPTDDRGQFRILGLPPGEYIVEAGELTPQLNSVPGTRPLSSYYPGTTDPLKAQMVAVTGESETRLNPMTLQSSPTRSVNIRMPAELQRNAAVSLRRKSDMGESRPAIMRNTPAYIVAPGVYEVFGGTYQMIEPRSTPMISTAVVGMTTLEVRDGDVEIDLPLLKSVKVSGHFSDSIGGIQVRLVPKDSTLLFPFNVTTGTDGKFSWAAVPSGSYTVDIPTRGKDPDGVYLRASDLYSFPENKCLDSVLQGNRDLLKDGLTIADKDIEFEISLRDQKTVIKGTVSNRRGEKADGAVVALVPDDRGKIALYASVTTDQNGAFEFRCAAPGDFHLFAWPELAGSAYRNAEFMKKFENTGTAIHVDDSPEQSIALRLIEP